MYVHTKEEILNNVFLSKFKDIAKYYGLNATYISIKEPPDVADVYVALYSDTKYMQALDKNKLRDLIYEDRREGGLNLKARMFGLKGGDDFVMHEQMMTYLQNVELILRAYKQYGVVPPVKISDEAALYIRGYYSSSVNFGIPQFKRAAYAEQLKLILQNTLKYYDPKTNKVIREDIDTGLTAKQNAQRPQTGRNKVTTDHLTRNAGRVVSIYVRAKFKDEIIKALNQTNYLYSVSPVIGEENANFASNELFGSKENNDTRRFVLSFDANYSGEVRQVIEKILYPSLFRMSYNDLGKRFGALGHLQILDETLGTFEKKCINARVPFVYDERGIADDLASLPVAYPLRYKVEMDSILRSIAFESESKKLAKDGLISEKDLITEKDLFKGGLVEIDPKDKDRVRIFGKTLDELIAEATSIEDILK